MNTNQHAAGETIALEISRLLRDARIQRGLTPVELADGFAYDRATINSWERLDTSPSIRTLGAVMAHLGFRIEMVLKPLSPEKKES